METPYVNNILGRVLYRYLWKFIELLTILILAKVLDIKEFGIAFFIMTILYFIMSFLEAGFYDEDTAKIKKFYNTLSIIAPTIGIIFALIFVFLSYILSAFSLSYKLAAIILFLSSLLVTPEVYFFTKNQLKKLYKAYTIAQIFMSILAVSFALSGLGYISVLIGYAVYYLGSSILLWNKFPFKLQPHINWNMIKELNNYFRNNFLIFVTSSLFSYGILLYTALTLSFVEFSYIFVAFMLGFFLYENITIFLNSQMLSYFKNQLKINFIRITEYYAFVIIPISFIAIMLSREIAFYLGETWIKASEVFIMIIIAGMLKALSESTRIILIVKLKNNVINRIRALEIITLVIALFLFKNFGVNGIALSVLLASIMSSGLYVIISKFIMKLEALAISRDYLYILISGILTALFVGLAKEIVLIKSLFSILMLASVSAVFYLIITFVFNQEIYKRFIRFVFKLMEQD